MSQQRRTFTKRQISTIIKIVFLESMLIVFILPSLQSTGEIPASFCPLPICREGKTIINIPIGQPSTTVFVPFPIPFTKNPTVGILNHTSNLVGSFDYNMVFQGPGNVVSTWTAMPAALTEIYGLATPCCQQFSQFFVDAILQCALVVNVMVAGSATAVLRVQVSPDDITWNNFLPAPADDTPINTIGLALPIGYSSSLASSGPFFRIVGLGGNGVTSPRFGTIMLECQLPSFSVIPAVNAFNVSATGFSLQAVITFPTQTVDQIIVTWIAHI